MPSTDETNMPSKPDLGAAVSEIKTALTGKAEELAGRSAESGAEAVSALGKTAATLAGSLQDQSPAVAEYVRSTGKHIDRLADDLRDKSAGELLTMATDFGKRQPLALLAGSAIASPLRASSRRASEPRRRTIRDRGRMCPTSAASTFRGGPR